MDPQLSRNRVAGNVNGIRLLKRKPFYFFPVVVISGVDDDDFVRLQQQMASIAVSLSGGGRRSAGTLPHHNSLLRTSPSIDTVRSVSKASSSTSSQRTGVSGKQIRNEIELLRKIIQDKDTLIQRYVNNLLI